MCDFCTEKMSLPNETSNKSISLQFFNPGNSNYGIGTVQYTSTMTWFSINYCPMCGRNLKI